MALKSTEEERAILRARSAVQRFPVVEWRQRMENFHKRSIKTSRAVAGSNAWRASDTDGGGVAPIGENDDWNQVTQADLTQPDWDATSINDQSIIQSPDLPAQWSQETLAPIDSHGERDYFSHSHGSTSGSNTPRGYTDFLERANRTFACDQRHAPDSFTEGGLTPNRPFRAHSSVTSMESISSIVEEKSNSPLNKAMTSVSACEFFDAYTYGLIVYGCRWGCCYRVRSKTPIADCKKFEA